MKTAEQNQMIRRIYEIELGRELRREERKNWWNDFFVRLVSIFLGLVLSFMIFCTIGYFFELKKVKELKANNLERCLISSKQVSLY